MNIMNNNITIGFNIDNSDKYASTLRGDTDMENGNFMTSKTRDRILAEVRILEDKKPEISTRIGDARLQGGLEENEELIMALEEMQRLDMDIHRHQEKLADVTLISQLSPGKHKIVKMLLNHPNIEVNAKTDNDDTALDIAPKNAKLWHSKGLAYQGEAEAIL